MSKPKAYFVLGLNGSGKSTYRDEMLKLPTGIIIVDPDKIAREHQCKDLEAGKIAIKQFREAVAEKKPVLSEGTLSDNSMLKRMQEAKTQGYSIKVHFIGLEDVNLHIDRVKDRVDNGGHNIPEPTIERRYPRVMENIPKLFPVADQLKIIDNSQASDPFSVQAEFVRDKIFRQAPDCVPWVKQYVLEPHRQLHRDFEGELNTLAENVAKEPF